jgi:hypothetical protein
MFVIFFIRLATYLIFYVGIFYFQIQMFQIKSQKIKTVIITH